MMMQIVEALGVGPLVDEARPADADNPRGYYELAAVQSIARESGFLADASGRALKVVSPLLSRLPVRSPGAGYRVILMERDLDEVLSSQAAMLDRSGDATERPPDEAMKRAFEGVHARALGWIEERADVKGWVVSHRELLASPYLVVHRVADFLGRAGNDRLLEQAASVVVPQLYRQRGSGSQTSAAR